MRRLASAVVTLSLFAAPAFGQEYDAVYELIFACRCHGGDRAAVALRNDDGSVTVR